MAKGQEVAVVYVRVEPSAKGFGSKLKAQAAPEVETASKSMGSRISSGAKKGISAVGKMFGRIGKTGLGAIATIGAGITGLAAKGGFDRALSIQQAQTKLKGLHHTGADIKSIMNSALESVRGTAYGLGDAASVAASLSASGIKSGSEMTATLKSVADTAAISGKSMTEVGAIFGSVAARGKLQGDDMLQLTSAGVPVLDMLAKHLHTTSAAVSKMVSKGKIDFKTFSAAMEENMGGAALATGNTFQGSLANVRAALGRLGASFEQPAVDKAPKLFQQISLAIDAVTKDLGPAVNWIDGKLSPAIDKATQFVKQFTDNVSSGKVSLGQLGGSLATAAAGFATLAGFGPRLTGIVTAIQSFAGSAGSQAQKAVSTVSKRFGGLPSAIGAQLRAGLPGITGVFNSQIRQSLALEGDPLAKTVDSLSSKLQSVGFKLSPAFKTMGEGIRQAGSGIDGVFGGLFSGLASKASYLSAATGVKMRSAFTPISRGVSNGLAVFKSKLTAAGSGIAFSLQNGLLSPFGRMGAGLQRAGSAIVSKISPIGQGISKAFGGIGQIVGPAASRAFQGIGGVLTNVAGTALNPATIVRTIGFGAIAAALVAGIGAIQQSSRGAITAAINNIATSLPGRIAAIVAQVRLAIPGIMQAGAQVITSAAGMLMQIIPPLVTGIGQALTGIITGLANALPTLVPQLAMVIMTLAQSLLAQIPQLLVAGAQLMKGLLQGIVQAIPMIVMQAPIIIQSLMSGFSAALPQLLDAGLKIVTGIATGLSAALPNILAAAPRIISTLVGGIMKAIPQILTTGLKMIAVLAQGLMHAIPQIAAAVPRVIMALVTGILTHLPQIITTGIKLLTTLIQGIVTALPQLIAMAPRIIISIVTGLITHLPQIITAGMQILGSLVKGIVNALPQLLSAVGRLPGQIVRGLGDVSRLLWNAGKSILNSLWEGMKSIWNNLTGWVSGIGDWIKAHKGPLSYDRTLLIPAGTAIMTGFGQGLQDQFNTGVAPFVSSIGDRISDLATQAGPIQLPMNASLNAQILPSDQRLLLNAQTEREQEEARLREQVEGLRSDLPGWIANLTPTVGSRDLARLSSSF